MWKDFKAFILRGNVMDLAVAVVIGAAFGAVVKSLMDDVIMPPIGVAAGAYDFSNCSCCSRKARRRPAVHDSSRSERRRRRDAQLRRVRQLARHLSDHRVLRVHDRANGEQAVREAARRRRTRSRARAARCRSRGRDALPELHVEPLCGDSVGE